tara:strand:+ start:533 stop:697 length:165 start_codon:yes stop_codon:yes gene_type:complete
VLSEQENTMRWTGLILSIAILGITTSLFIAFGADAGHSLTIRSAEPGAIAQEMV